MTLKEWLRRAEAQLAAGPHPERARRDAETLLIHHTGRNRAWLMTHGDEEFGGCSAIGYASLLDRRQRGEPLQYITGEAEFYGLPFRLTPAVLIPRPETEHLVEKVIELCRGVEGPRIVDMGTGSGAIAVALAHELPNAQVTATDISSEALMVARQNAQANGVGERIRFLHGDLLVPLSGELFDVVASNPPYVSSSNREALSVEVRDFEPETALFAGADGLAIYRRLIPQAANVLEVGGYLVMEIGYDQQESIRQLLAEARYADVDFVADLQGIARVAIARRP